ncbi:MAG: carboxypeptidase regulatory-like domain-containing protein, partial [Gemmatimonadetes bacterium]|nr:carboxypeptidase regulatory-like domain-containing protein [Gemmatimonadota bacterium]
MHRNLIIPLGIAWALLHTPAHAQVLRGVLVDSATSLPIDAAFVVLLGASGVERARILTDGLGRFVLRAPEPGGYRLKSERIGYRSVLSPLFQLGDGSEIEYQLR